ARVGDGLVGTPEQVTEGLLSAIAQGARRITVHFGDAPRPEGAYLLPRLCCRTSPCESTSIDGLSAPSANTVALDGAGCWLCAACPPPNDGKGQVLH
ncbi:MAG: hypothetical protein HC802_06570, partial [Caldilineaceae bacterium]|nr:hypothetical protein [Caldilineaceae bacterium]